MPWIGVALMGACCSTPEQAPAPQVEAGPGGETSALGPLKRPPASAGISVEEAWEPERLVYAAGYDLIVLTVVGPETRRGTTNADPPRLGIHVDEVLGGKASTGERQAVWAPPPHGVDWVGSGSREALAAWGARPLAGPAAGAKLIALGKEVGGAYRIAARLREPFTVEGRARWLARLEAERQQREGAPR
ncbi:MAG: hypothetical protein IT385_10195 [Deltaproteobacteria bacterium]|nr:hypothetical protein [Deltaproteobacteria bacterium]